MNNIKKQSILSVYMQDGSEFPLTDTELSLTAFTNIYKCLFNPGRPHPRWSHQSR